MGVESWIGCPLPKVQCLHQPTYRGLAEGTRAKAQPQPQECSHSDLGVINEGKLLWGLNSWNMLSCMSHHLKTISVPS